MGKILALLAAVGLGAAALFAITTRSNVSAAEAEGPPLPVVERVFDAEHGLTSTWADYGWTPHVLRAGAPAALDMSGYGGLILARPGLSTPFGGLSFRYRAPSSYGTFLEVRVEDGGGNVLGRVRLSPDRGRPSDNGFTQMFLPMSELNPRGKRFERLVFAAWRSVAKELVLLDAIGFTAAPLEKPSPARTASFVLDCRAPGHRISPLVYGTAYRLEETPRGWEIGSSAVRWGGNPTSRYNWKVDAWNTNHDWFFRNVSRPGKGMFPDFWRETKRRGLPVAVSVPMVGWVAKDDTSYSFPVSVYGPQQSAAPELPDAGNGVRKDGQPIAADPARTSIPFGAVQSEEWVRKLEASGGGAREYILDNEPMLWHETQRDVHPAAATYDEVLERTVAFASAIRRAAPHAKIAGPTAWGWLAYQHSANDIKAGARNRPDRRAHGDVPFIPWYLRKLREHEAKTGVRLLDILDVHFYPAASGVYGPNNTDPETSALRLRSTRSLWDPSYTDESWIAERMRVLPLLREWVDANYPGTGISIGEWNFGAEGHMSGGLAAAEALGRFGEAGLDSAYYWNLPPDDSPAFWAFRAYRNYDGKGGHFLERHVAVKGGAPLASLFASSDGEKGRFVAVVLNMDPKAPLDASITGEGCGTVALQRAFTYAGKPEGFEPYSSPRVPGPVALRLAPYSISVLELRGASANP